MASAGILHARDGSRSAYFTEVKSRGRVTSFPAGVVLMREGPELWRDELVALPSNCLRPEDRRVRSPRNRPSHRSPGRRPEVSCLTPERVEHGRVAPRSTMAAAFWLRRDNQAAPVRSYGPLIGFVFLPLASLAQNHPSLIDVGFAGLPCSRAPSRTIGRNVGSRSDLTPRREELAPKPHLLADRLR